MADLVRLSVHRNTKDQRARRQVRSNLRGDAGSIARHDVAGYAIVAWDRDGRTQWTSFDPGVSSVTPRAVPDFVRSTLEVTLNAQREEL